MLSFLRRKPARPAPRPDAVRPLPDPEAEAAARHDGAKSLAEKDDRRLALDEDGMLVIVGDGAQVEPGGRGPLPMDGERLRLLSGSHVESVPGRCVQCGICSYNCPVGIDVRSYSRRAMPVLESHCILCGECVARCPRGVLRFHRPAGEA